MKKRCIVIIIDGFGIGAMADANRTRPGDEKSNTFASILHNTPQLFLPNLESLGLMNAYGKESKQMKFSNNAVFGTCELQHIGADTFMGHQEIMGTYPKAPRIEAFQAKIDEIQTHLESLGHKVEVKTHAKLRYLLVDHYCTVADNIDADLGMAYNCTAPLDNLSFENVVHIAKAVRSIANVNRVIAFGGTQTTIDDILQAEEVKENTYIGIHAAKSKSYEHGYQCLHFGYGVDASVQVPTLLGNNKIPVSLFGKVADIVMNDQGRSTSCVDTNEVLDLTIAEMKRMKYGCICTNIQETDLAGHCQNVKNYTSLLQRIDKKIGDILALLQADDLFVIMADHGNDPCIGHHRHTRENIPLLIRKSGVQGINLGLRTTLSDVGATICDYFQVPAPQHGTSFLDQLI